MELSDHLGYERGDPAGRGSPNSWNGTTPKTVSTEVGPIGLDVPRDHGSSFEPRLIPKGQRRVGGLDEMIISLYAGGMTGRDIQHHLARTIGTEVSHETISKITDAVLDEVKAWQTRPLEECYPVVYLDAGGQGLRRAPGPEEGRAHRRRGQTQSPARLVEGAVVHGWKPALGALAIAYPDQLATSASHMKITYTDKLASRLVIGVEGHLCRRVPHR